MNKSEIAELLEKGQNAVYDELRQIYCCEGAEFSRPTLEKAWKEIARLHRALESTNPYICPVQSEIAESFDAAKFIRSRMINGAAVADDHLCQNYFSQLVGLVSRAYEKGVERAIAESQAPQPEKK